MGRVQTVMTYAELSRLLLTDDVDPETGPRLVIIDVDDVTGDARLVWEHEDLYAHEVGVEPVMIPHDALIESFMLPPDEELSVRSICPVCGSDRTWAEQIPIGDIDGVRQTMPGMLHCQDCEAREAARRRLVAAGLRKGMTGEEAANVMREAGRMVRCVITGRCADRGTSPYVAIPEMLECGLPAWHEGDHVWEGVIDGMAARSTWANG